MADDHETNSTLGRSGDRSQQGARAMRIAMMLATGLLGGKKAVAAPTNSVRPGAITGTLTIGSTLTSPDTGTWTGTPAPTLTRQWYNADPTYSAGGIVTSGGDVVYTNPQPIASATASTYVLQSTDANKVVFCRVTGTNTAGTSTKDTLCTPSVILDAAAAAFLARVTVKTDLRQTLYNTLVLALKAGSVWTALDALYVTAAENSQAALLNLASNSFGLTAHSSPTFTADRGYLTDGSASYLDTGFNPATAGGQYALNAAHMGVFSRTEVQGNFDMGARVSSSNSQSCIAARNASNNFLLRVNADAASPTIASTTSVGHFVGRRSDATTEEAFKNAVSLGASAVQAVAAALPSLSFFIGGVNTAGALSTGVARQYSAAHFGANLSNAQVTALYNALQAYMTAVGA